MSVEKQAKFLSKLSAKVPKNLKDTVDKWYGDHFDKGHFHWMGKLQAKPVDKNILYSFDIDAVSNLTRSVTDLGNKLKKMKNFNKIYSKPKKVFIEFKI